MFQRLLGKEKRTTFIATCDQGVVSLGTFLANLMLARHLPPALYGTYAVFYGVMLVAGAVHMSLVALPMCIKAAADAPATRRYASASALLTIAMQPLFAIVLVALAAHLSLLLGVAAALALAAWHLQENFRRALIARLRYAACIAGDAVMYLGQAGAVVWLVRSGRLSLTAVFFTLAISASAGALLHAALLGLERFSADELREYTRQFWDMGRWMLSGSAALNLGTQLFPWTLAAALGTAEAARYQAMATVLGVCNPLLFSLPTVVTPAVAAVREQGLDAVYRITRHYTLQYVALGAPYLLLVAAIPTVVLTRFYGAASPYVHLGLEVRIFAAACALQFIWSGLGGMLNGLERTRATSHAQVVSLGAIVALGIPLCVWLGVMGAAIAAVLASGLRLLVMLRYTANLTLPRPAPLPTRPRVVILEEPVITSSAQQ